MRCSGKYVYKFKNRRGSLFITLMQQCKGDPELHFIKCICSYICKAAYTAAIAVQYQVMLPV